MVSLVSRVVLSDGRRRALDLGIQICFCIPVTNHEFLVFLAASHEHYGAWPDPQTLYAYLRLNTPEGQVRWDQQARALIVRMLKKGLIRKIPCAEATSRPGGCGKAHLALTKLGEAQLETWNEMGCDAHTHVGNCHAPDLDVEFERKKVG